MTSERHDQPEGHDHDPEELRARLEEELSKITVTDVLVQTVVTLINLGGQRLGLSETAQAASDPDQTRVAIEAVRALLPLLEADEQMAQQVKPVRDALAQLQMAYAQRAGTAPPASGQPREEDRGDAPAGEAARAAATDTGQPGSRRSTSRLWVPPGTKS